METRERLLQAARRLFAEHGFRHVTVRRICREAGANVAAVSYYFGNKLGLYQEVIGEAIATVRAVDPTVDAPASGPPAERIRHYIHAHASAAARNADRLMRLTQVLRHEIWEPSSLAAWMAEQIITPRIRYLSDAVAELLDCAVDDPRVARCAVSIHAQCLFLLPSRFDRFRAVAFPHAPDMTPAELDRMADHIAEFSLAGIERLARTPPTED